MKKVPYACNVRARRKLAEQRRNGTNELPKRTLSTVRYDHRRERPKCISIRNYLRPAPLRLSIILRRQFGRSDLSDVVEVLGPFESYDAGPESASGAAPTLVLKTSMVSNLDVTYINVLEVDVTIQSRIPKEVLGRCLGTFAMSIPHHRFTTW